MAGQRLRGLHHHPAGVRVALLGDAAVIAVFGALMGGRHQAQIGGGAVAVGETRDVAQSSEQSLGHREIDAGQSHQQADAGIGVGLDGEIVGERGEFCFETGELAQMTVQGLAAQGIELEGGQPGAGARLEQIAGGRLDQALVEHGVDAVLQAGAVGHQVGALGGESAAAARVGIRLPDPGQEVAA